MMEYINWYEKNLLKQHFKFQMNMSFYYNLLLEYYLFKNDLLNSIKCINISLKYRPYNANIIYKKIKI